MGRCVPCLHGRMAAVTSSSPPRLEGGEAVLDRKGISRPHSSRKHSWATAPQPAAVVRRGSAWMRIVRLQALRKDAGSERMRSN